MKSGVAAAGDTPLEGAKTQGRIEPQSAASASGGPRTSAEPEARKASEEAAVAKARRVRLSQRQAGRTGREARAMPRKGKPSKG